MILENEVSLVVGMSREVREVRLSLRYINFLSFEYWICKDEFFYCVLLGELLYLLVYVEWIYLVYGKKYKEFGEGRILNVCFLYKVIGNFDLF